MAITQDSQPSAGHHFAYRPVVYTVSSGDGTIIRCICDVYINGTYEVSIEKSPNIGDTNTFTFDLQSVLQDYISHHAPAFTIDTNKVYAATSGVNYNARFFEVLDNGTTFDTSWAEDGAGTAFYDTTATYNPAYAFNGTLRHEETIAINSFQSGNGYAGLSRLNEVTTTYKGINTCKVRKIKRGDYAILTSWYDSGATQRGSVKQYDSNDTIISTDNTTAVASATNHLWQYALGTGFLDATCKKFLMRHETTAAGAISDYVHFEIVEDCNDYVSLYWQNDFGGFDYYLFRDGQVKTFQGESDVYKKPLTTSFNVYDFGTAVYGKSSKTSVACVSEVIDRATANALSNLITHGVRAWIFDGTNFIPVVTVDGSMSTLNTNDGTYRVNVEVMYSNDNPVQRY